MKPVNRNIPVKSGKIRKKGIIRPGKSGKTPKPEKVPCLSRLVSKNTTTSTDQTIPEIPGVEQLDSVPPGSKEFVAGFQSDEVAILIKRAKNVLDRSDIFIAPRVGWPKSIYWRVKP